MLRFCPACAGLTAEGEPGEECPDCRAGLVESAAGVEVHEDDGGDPYLELGGEGG